MTNARSKASDRLAARNNILNVIYDIDNEIADILDKFDAATAKAAKLLSELLSIRVELANDLSRLGFTTAPAPTERRTGEAFNSAGVDSGDFLSTGDSGASNLFVLHVQGH